MDRYMSTFQMQKVPAEVRSVVTKLSSAQYLTGLMGDCVIRLITGHYPYECEVVTSAPPEKMLELFQDNLKHYSATGTYLVRAGDEDIFVRTFRDKCIYNDDGTHIIELGCSLQNEIATRSFVLETMFLNLSSGQLIDLHDAQQDIWAKRLKTNGDPYKRIQQDKLCMLRAAKLKADYNLSLDPELVKAISASSADIVKVSPTRVREEILDICASSFPEVAFQTMLDLGLMEHVLPEVYNLVGHEQSFVGVTHKNLWTHTMGVVKTLAAEGANYLTVFAGLLHDIGEPEFSRRNKDGAPEQTSTLGHASIGSVLVNGICRRLKIRDELTHKLRAIVKEHDTAHHGRTRSQRSIETWLEGLERQEILEDVIFLQMADSRNGDGEEDLQRYYSELVMRLDKMNGRIRPAQQQETKQFGLTVVKPQPKPISPHILAAVKEAQEDGLIPQEQSVK